MGNRLAAHQVGSGQRLVPSFWNPPMEPQRTFPVSFTAATHWTVLVGIPLCYVHLNDDRFTLIEHIRAGVLFFVSLGLIWWLGEKYEQRATERAARNPRTASSTNALRSGLAADLAPRPGSPPDNAPTSPAQDG